jgi:hypothetical protein
MRSVPQLRGYVAEIAFSVKKFVFIRAQVGRSKEL